MTKLRVILAAIFFVLTAMASRGNVQDSANDKKIAAEASAAYDAKDWIKSAALYEKLTQAHPETPRLWFRLGASLQELGQLRSEEHMSELQSRPHLVCRLLLDKKKI